MDLFELIFFFISAMDWVSSLISFSPSLGPIISTRGSKEEPAVLVEVVLFLIGVGWIIDSMDFFLMGIFLLFPDVSETFVVVAVVAMTVEDAVVLAGTFSVAIPSVLLFFLDLDGSCGVCSWSLVLVLVFAVVVDVIVGIVVDDFLLSPIGVIWGAIGL